MPNPLDEPQLDAQIERMINRLALLRDHALLELVPAQQERARELIAAGGNLRCHRVSDSAFEFRLCARDGGLDGSVLLMTLPRSAVLGEPADN